jgi:FkbM family methyltransferase
MTNYQDYSHLFRGNWSIYNEEKPTWDVVKSFLNPGCVFFDIGCQKGIYSEGVISVLGSDCSIYGFDVLEHPDIIQLQKENKNFKFINSAVGDGKSSVDCVIHYDTNTKLINQKTISLDQFCEKNNIKKIDFIKIDVDGCEGSVLNGSKKILKTFCPTLVIEIENNLEEYITLMREFGYNYMYSRNDVNRFFVKNE